MQKPSTPKGDGGHTLGDYPNAANIREWMRLYFGWTPQTTIIRFTSWYAHGELPDINTPAAALHFGLSKGYRLTDAGRAKAYELGILSDDSPAIPIEKQVVSKLRAVEDRKRRAALHTAAALTTLQKSYLRSYFIDNELEFKFVRVEVEPGEHVFMLQEGALFGKVRQGLHGKDITGAGPTLQTGFDERALLAWALNHGPSLNAAGLQRARELGLLPGAKQANTRKAKAETPSKRGPKPKYFLRRSCVKACIEKGFEQSGVEAAFDAYREECNFNAQVIPNELEAITDNTIKHDLAWLRDKKNVLPGLQGDNKAEFSAFKKWLKGWTP